MPAEIALAAGNPERPLELQLDASRTLAAHFGHIGLPVPEALAALGPRPTGRVYLGHEFCEHLLPSPAFVARSLAVVNDAGIALTLATPMASDGCLRQLRRLLPLLPEATEVLCNDWGVAALVRRDYPALRVVAGRSLCKMIKDPRLPSAQWMRLQPHGLDSPAFVGLLDRMGVAAMEIDAPPFADAAFFSGLPRPLHVHIPFGYAAKGRTCKIAGLGRGAVFAPGMACQRQCLAYTARMRRRDPPGGGDLATVLCGNTVLYRYPDSLSAAVAEAAGAQRIRRLVLGSP